MELRNTASTMLLFRARNSHQETCTAPGHTATMISKRLDPKAICQQTDDVHLAVHEKAAAELKMASINDSTLPHPWKDLQRPAAHLAAEGQVQGGARVAGINDRVQPHPLPQRVHQPLAQLVVVCGDAHITNVRLAPQQC